MIALADRPVALPVRVPARRQARYDGPMNAIARPSPASDAS